MYMSESDVYMTIIAMLKQSAADCYWFPFTQDGKFSPVVMTTAHGGFCDAFWVVLEQEDKESMRLLSSLNIKADDVATAMFHNFFTGILPFLVCLFLL